MNVKSESVTYHMPSYTWNSLKVIGIQAKRLKKKNSLELIDIIVHEHFAYLLEDLAFMKIHLNVIIKEAQSESQKCFTRLVVAKEEFYLRLNAKKDKYKKNIRKFGAVSAINDLMMRLANLNHEISNGIRGIYVLRMYPSLDIDIDDNKLEPLEMVMSQCKQEIQSIKQWAVDFGLLD